MHQHKGVRRDDLTPKQALSFLIEGNNRFINNLSLNKNLLQMVNETKDSQFPFVSILSCSDSRTATELVFDQGLGDIFSVRLIGNVATANAVASLEYACKYLGSKLIVVLGHTGCGAVRGACDGISEGHIGEVLHHIKPAVALETTVLHNRSSSNKVFVNNVVHLNVEVQIQAILDQSRLLFNMLKSKEIGIVGGLYDLETGRVTFNEEDLIFDATHQFPNLQNQLIHG